MHEKSHHCVSWFEAPLHTVVNQLLDLQMMLKLECFSLSSASCSTSEENLCT